MPYIHDDTAPGTELITLGCSLGAYHAVHFSLQRADLAPLAIGLSGNYDVTTWGSWGDRGDATYFANPTDYVPNLHGDHLDWLRRQVSILLVVGQGAWETHPTGSLPSTIKFAGSPAGEGHPLRAGSVGLRRESRLGVVAAPARPPSATLLLIDRSHEKGGSPVSDEHHLVGLLLGAEEDWPQAFEAIVHRIGAFSYDGQQHVLDTERVRISPFNLRDPVRHEIVIDRLAYWYYHPREWLKKAALMNDVYLLNSPFTFQSMEKHSAYCAMMRLGMHIPDTVLVPYKNPVDNSRWAYTAGNYNDSVRPAGASPPTWATRCS